MFAAATDHVFLDGGHALGLHQQGLRGLGPVGLARRGSVLPTLVAGTASAGRSEEQGSWALSPRTRRDLPRRRGDACRPRATGSSRGRA